MSDTPKAHVIFETVSATSRKRCFNVIYNLETFCVNPQVLLHLALYPRQHFWNTLFPDREAILLVY